MGFEGSRAPWIKRFLLERFGHRVGFSTIAKEHCRSKFDISAYSDLISEFLNIYTGDTNNPRRSLLSVKLLWDDLIRIEAEKMLRARGQLKPIVVHDELLLHRIIMSFLWHEQRSNVVKRIFPFCPQSDIYVLVRVPTKVAMSRVRARDRGRRDERQVVKYEEFVERSLSYLRQTGGNIVEVDGLQPPRQAAESLADVLSARTDRLLSDNGTSAALPPPTTNETKHRENGHPGSLGS